VLKLFTLSRADAAFFGEKDYQQLRVIQRMALDLNLSTEVIGRPIVRESGGLALSSRNSYLSPEERARAAALWKTLSAVRGAFRSGEHGVDRLEELARRTLEESGLRVDYAEVRDSVELQRPQRADGASRLFLAAFLGKTRLIDNGALGEAG
jgi:pantoate--beta-alanine ligase